MIIKKKIPTHTKKSVTQRTDIFFSFFDTRITLPSFDYIIYLFFFSFHLPRGHFLSFVRIFLFSFLLLFFFLLFCFSFVVRFAPALFLFSDWSAVFLTFIHIIPLPYQPLAASHEIHTHTHKNKNPAHKSTFLLNCLL